MFALELAILVYSVILHEIAHGFVADKLGDPTARLAKRLTLNPIPHIDPFLTIALPLLLILPHILNGSQPGIIFGGAKPIPIDPFNFRDPKKDTAIVSLSGPVTNILIAVFFSLLIRGLLALNSGIFFVSPELLNSLAESGIRWNVILAIFNLFPLPPLDGFKVLAGLVSDDLASEMYRLERYGFLIIIFVLFFFPNLIFGIIGPAIHTLTSLLIP